MTPAKEKESKKNDTIEISPGVRRERKRTTPPRCIHFFKTKIEMITPIRKEKEKEENISTFQKKKKNKSPQKKTPK